jgi:hypothetical protein
LPCGLGSESYHPWPPMGCGSSQDQKQKSAETYSPKECQVAGLPEEAMTGKQRWAWGKKKVSTTLAVQGAMSRPYISAVAEHTLQVSRGQ